MSDATRARRDLAAQGVAKGTCAREGACHFLALCAGQGDEVARLLVLLVGPVESVEALVAETFVRAFCAWSAGAHGASAAVLLRRAALEVARARGVTGCEVGSSSGALGRALGVLEPTDRAVFVLQELLGLDPGEVGAALAISPRAVRARLERARRVVWAAFARDATLDRKEPETQRVA